MEEPWKITVNDELAKNPKLKIEDIDYIRRWMKDQPELPKISDNQIILFLHAACYGLPEAKKLIETYYKMRTQYKHYFSQRDPFDEKIVLATNVSPFVIYGKDNCGRRVLWSKLLQDDPHLYYPTMGTKSMFMSLDVDQLENGTVPGYTLVLDGKGFTLSHAMRCSFSNGRQVVAYVQTASTVIIEKVFLLNMTPASEKILTILRPFIRSELLNKITICTEDKISKIYDTIPKESIPSDYNGEGPSIKALADAEREKLQSYRDWFAYEETKRLKNPKANSCDSSDLGSEGTFSNLSID